MRHFGWQREPPHSRFVVLFDARGRSFPDPLCQKGCFLGAVVLEPLWAASGIFENQGATISERDFGCLTALLTVVGAFMVMKMGLRCASIFNFKAKSVETVTEAARFFVSLGFLQGEPHVKK